VDGASRDDVDDVAVGVASVDDVVAGLGAQGYLTDEGLATAVFLALRLQRPLFLEGDAGVGKTEVARALAAWTGGSLVRLQCHDGIDAAQALYEWDHARQLLHLRAAEATQRMRATSDDGIATTDTLEAELYDERFLVRRPLLTALAGRPGEPPPVLLVDEVDRADDEFEAFLLELLADWSVTIPELGTVRASVIPIAVLTSNRTRDVHDALKRRCLYHWVEHPDLEREVAIVAVRAPEVAPVLARQVASAVGGLRRLGLYKPPGIAETIDWARALATLGRTELDDGAVAATLGAVVKYREDEQRIRQHGIGELVREAVLGA
jgi:MoxR-like ATPase